MKKKEQAQKAAKWWADKVREKATDKNEKEIEFFEKYLCNLIFDEICGSRIYEVTIVCESTIDGENEPEGILAMAALISFVDYSMLPSRISMKITEKDIKVKDSNKSMYERIYESI